MLTKPLRPCLEALEDRALPAVTIQFDYRYDTQGFFRDPARRAALQQAANSVTAPLGDSLLGIRATGRNKWFARFDAPNNGRPTTLENLVVPANTLIVFVGSRSLSRPNGTWSLAASDDKWGGVRSSASGKQDWKDRVAGRGQPGALGNGRTDTSTWGGAIAFDTSKTPWHFGGPNTPVPRGRYDFFSAAAHEVGHLLGFSVNNPAFRAHRDYPGPFFDGPAVRAANNGRPIALDRSGSGTHWAASARNPDGRVPAMAPPLPAGQRRPFTRIDFAALKDIGWQVSGATAGARGPHLALAVPATTGQLSFAAPPAAVGFGDDRPRVGWWS